MKRIVDGKRYDTETAEEVFEWGSHGNIGPSDFRFHVTTLYRTKNGHWFLAGHGGPMSRWSQSAGGNSWTGGEGLQPVEECEALFLLEEQRATDAIEKYFADKVVDA